MDARTLDSMVEKYVFGKTSCLCAYGSTCDMHDGPPYSTDLVAAMKVLDHMRKLGHCWLLNMDEGGFHLRRVACVVRDWERDEKRYVADHPLGWAQRLEDLPEVICLAAVREVQEKLHAAMTPKDRRDPTKPPRPDMTWSERHKMWVDPDTRSPERKKKDEEIAAEVESRLKRGKTPDAEGQA